MHDDDIWGIHNYDPSRYELWSHEGQGRNARGQFERRYDRDGSIIDEFDRWNEETSPTEVQEFLRLFKDAKLILCETLEEYNVVKSPLLKVQRGGVNFVALAKQLRDLKGFNHRSEFENDCIAAFVIKAFELEKQTRCNRSKLVRDELHVLRFLRGEV